MGLLQRLSFLNSTKAWYVYAALLVGVLGTMAWYVYDKHKKDTVPLNMDVPNTEMHKGEVVIYFFFADWCPHCVSAKPIWTSIQNKYNNRFINGFKMKLTERDCSENDDDQVKNWMKQYKVKGFPTIKMMKQGETIDFDARITNDSLEKFINDLTG